MTNHVIDRAPVTAGLKTMFLTAFVGGGTGGTNLYVEVGSAPATLNKDSQGRLIDPYGILYPITSVRLYGSVAYPEDGATLTYQGTWVGRTAQSAQIMADRGRRIAVERSAGGGFLHPLNAGASMSVVDRRQRELGTAEASEGLWQVVDVYEIEVQAV